MKRAAGLDPAEQLAAMQAIAQATDRVNLLREVLSWAIAVTEAQGAAFFGPSGGAAPQLEAVIEREANGIEGWTGAADLAAGQATPRDLEQIFRALIPGQTPLFLTDPATHVQSNSALSEEIAWPQQLLCWPLRQGDRALGWIVGWMYLPQAEPAGPQERPEATDRATLVPATALGESTDWQLLVTVAALAIDRLECRAAPKGLAETRAEFPLGDRDSAEKFRVLYEQDADAIMLLDERGFLECNQATLDLFGYSSVAAFCSKHPCEVSPPVQPDGQPSARAANARIQTAMQEGHARFEWVHSRLDGSTFPAEVILKSLEISGQLVLQAVVRDISDRKAAEAALLEYQQQLETKTHDLERALENLHEFQIELLQKEKMSTLGNLVAGIGHEINNPIGFLSGNLGILSDYLKDLFGLIELYEENMGSGAEKSEMIEKFMRDIDLDYVRDDLPKLIEGMQEGVTRIASLSQSLRTFSRGDVSFPVAFQVNEGLDSTVTILRHRLRASNRRGEILVEKDYAELPEIQCYAGQISQVFMNLLSNAIDAINELHKVQEINTIYEQQNGSINPDDLPRYRIFLKTALSSNGEAIQVTIADNGIGMSEMVKQRLFDRLFTTKAVGQGTGLGLAIVHQIIVGKHGGSIQVTSQPGQGAEFVLSLPIACVLPSAL